jgi:hypothetical protein
MAIDGLLKSTQPLFSILNRRISLAPLWQYAEDFSWNYCPSTLRLVRYNLFYGLCCFRQEDELIDQGLHFFAVLQLVLLHFVCVKSGIVVAVQFLTIFFTSKLEKDLNSICINLRTYVHNRTAGKACTFHSEIKRATNFHFFISLLILKLSLFFVARKLHKDYLII